MMREVVYTEAAPRPIGPYSQGIKARGLLFVAGQIAIDPMSGKMAGPSIQTQTRQALDNVTAILTAGGSSLADVVKLTLYLENLGEFDKVNEILEQHFTSEPPVRETVEVSKLPRGAMIEISAVALTMKED